MMYRLTYALTHDEVITTTFTSHTSDIVKATEEAFALIEEEHGAVGNLVAVSLLKAEVPQDGKPN